MQTGLNLHFMFRSSSGMAPNWKSMSVEWLSDDQISRHGILKKQYVAKNIQALRAGEFLASKRLVTMIGLHMWLDANGVGTQYSAAAVPVSRFSSNASVA